MYFLWNVHKSLWRLDWHFVSFRTEEYISQGPGAICLKGTHRSRKIALFCQVPWEGRSLTPVHLAELPPVIEIGYLVFLLRKIIQQHRWSPQQPNMARINSAWQEVLPRPLAWGPVTVWEQGHSGLYIKGEGFFMSLRT